MIRFLFVFIVVSFSSGCADGRSQADRISDKIISLFVAQMENKGLRAAGTGGGASQGKINLVEVSFATCKSININQSRNLIVTSVNTLLDIINRCPENEEYFIEFPVNLNHIHISIINDVQSSDPDSIRCVSLIKGNVHYCRDNPEIMPFEEVHEETFEEAQRTLENGSIQIPVF